ncbi:MAG: hypothetical protein GXO70_04755 [Acidobacteria bacterium]|nr:hypothetical protein [Acidobacteriota bacterium]
MFWILATYLAVLALYSIVFVSRSRTEAGFFVSGRQLGTFTLSLTIAATTIGGSAVVVTWTLIHRYGAWGIAPDVAGGAGLCLLGIWLAARVRRTEKLTLPELLKSHFPPGLVKLLAIAIVLAQIAWLALSFRSLQIISGLTSWELVVICSLTWGYAFIGGQWSVSRTDVLQFAILAGGFLFAAITGGKFHLPHTGHIGLPLAYLVALMFFSHLIGPDVFAKIFSAASKSTASRSAVAAGILKILFSLLLLAAFSTGLDIGKLNLILFLAVASAILSSVDSIFISATAILERDILELNHKRFTPHLVGIALLVLSLGFTLSGVGVVKILASGYTVFLVALFFPTLSVLLKGRSGLTSLWLPVITFTAVWAPFGLAAAFFAAFAVGGLTLAFENHNRQKTDPAQ